MPRSSHAILIHVFAIVLLALCLHNPAAAQSTYTITDLGTVPDNPWTYPYAINIHGELTGLSANDGATNSRAFLYDDGSLTSLGVLDPDPTDILARSMGFGINASAQIAGGSVTFLAPSRDSFSRAFLYSGGTMLDLGTLGGDSSWGFGINDSGQVTGYADVTGNTATHAFVYGNGAMKDLGTLGGSFSQGNGINNSGQITGLSTTATGLTHAFLYSGGRMRDLRTLGGNYSEGAAINAFGQIAGSSIRADGTYHAFLYTNRRMLDLGTLPGADYSVARGINNAGQVVGYSSAAFLYVPGRGMVDLNDVVAGSGWTVAVAYGINDFGQIAVFGNNPTGTPRGFLLTPPPMLQLITLLQSFQLASTISRPLLAELQAAEAAGEGSGTYCSDLSQFISRVQSLAGRRLTAAQAAQLIAMASDLRTSANCY